MAIPLRANLSAGPIRCAIHTDDPLPADAYEKIVAPLQRAVEQAAQELAALGMTDAS